MTAICIIGTVIFSVISIFLYKFSKKQKNFAVGLALALCGIVTISVGLELTLFNINFYSSKGFEKQDITPYVQTHKGKDGTYTFMKGKEILISNVNKEINNIHVDLDNKNPDERTVVSISFTDEANKFYFNNPKRVIYRDVEKSQYINIHTSGKAENLILTFDSEKPITKVQGISINEPRPFEFSFARVSLLFIILSFLYIFRPSSPIYKKKFSSAKDLKNTLTLGFIFLQCILIIVVGTMNPTFLGFEATDEGKFVLEELPMEHHNQYDHLAQAILDGKVYIDNDDVPQELIEMNNPYDPMARYESERATGNQYRWDVAYFNGHYYVYFGIVPLLLMYLPCRAIFDAPFPSAVGIIVFAMIFAVGVYKLIGLIIEKYFKRTSVGVYLLLSLVTVNCSGAMFLVKRPDFYSVPIITALAFIVWGIFLWLKGINSKKHQWIYYLFGSLFCALAVGCRPQMVLMSFVAIPIFWSYFFKEKNITKKSGIINLCVLAIPYIVVAAGIMYYNYIRFGSPIDFGSSYNLTTNDVTKRGFEFGRTGLGIYTYLLQPPNFKGVFPYIEPSVIETNYIGKTITEFCFGGLLSSLPILWFILCLPKVYKYLKEKKLFALTLSFLLIGLALVIADTQAGGLLQRYYSDFGLAFFMGAIFIILALLDSYKEKNSAFSLKSLIFTCVILSINYAVLLVFSVADVTIDIQNPTLYGNILHIIEFWL